MTYKNDDSYLLDSLVKGNDKGILDIYKMMYPKILAYIKKHDGTEEDAKEIFQKALLQMVVRVSKGDFALTTSFGGYFFTVCRNLWIKETKISKHKVTNDTQLHLISEEREIALGALEQEKWDLFQEKLSSLSDNCKEVLAKVFEKKPYVQIADELGYNSENVVRQRVHKCKAKLKEAIQKDSRYLQMKEI